MTPAERRETASAWCLRMAEGDLSPPEAAERDAWLNAHRENRAVFGHMAAIWLAAPYSAETPEMIAMRADALEAMRAANARRWSRDRVSRWLWPLLPIAAALVLAFVGILSTFSVFGPGTVIYRTGVGERRVVRLDDGSRLSLDAASRVEVAFAARTRVLHLLAGRAKFDVAHDPARPFSVTAGDRTVIATGTAFSVELVRREVRVVLYQGHVRVVTAGPGAGQEVALAGWGHGDRAADDLLTSGKTLVAPLDRPVATVRPVDPQRSLAWEGGQLTFADDPLAVAVERVDRYSDTPIVVEGSAASLPISGSFNSGDPAAFVNGARALYPLRAVRRGNAIVLSAP